ncbi:MULTISPECIES: pyridoxamine 5'-phosphate oxidase family protein [unclassified Enterococcus]|uniref:pyridoxamine 5'-phosphate oxidase family protein n=1 Tax=unclassified Enterococcus TaxID=2608891 RepID=UPI001CE10D07|nr:MULTISPECIES: pyridoxamine 5'-phosphate oxidase family protein [unclassified Enterococcus]MCA5012425.1 pyridoxamine 5'-phosphate oxidase family protein [Enterococcus sp. S23]MCA5015676.1 pyridoxamine 5'-phosphate oxidase family protein [Enterococcus sp. S22(2020)]
MEIHERIVRLLNSSKVFLLATIDKREFPTVITVSAPLWREGLLKLQFYLDGEGETVKNIRCNPNGSVCCYEEIAHESLLLKGKFSVEEVGSKDEITSRLSDYQKELNHQAPVLVTFETWTARIHMDKKTKDIIV